MSVNQKKIVARCHETIELANSTFEIVLPPIPILFNLSGRMAGYAIMDNWQPSLKFNCTLVDGAGFQHIHDNTVPHEIAHIVCMLYPAYGKNHDTGWKNVCLALGGNGKRIHYEEVIYGGGPTYLYTTTTGDKVRVSHKRHKNILAGACYHCDHASGYISDESPFEIINPK